VRRFAVSVFCQVGKRQQVDCDVVVQAAGPAALDLSGRAQISDVEDAQPP
jgi:hypothetical protein